MLAQYLLMVLWGAIIAAIPIGWFVLGLRTYGTLDYDGAQRTPASYLGEPMSVEGPTVH